MKRLLISLAILTGIISLSFFGAAGIDTTCDKITEDLNRAISLSKEGNFSAAEKYCKQSEERFRKYETFFIGFINRETAENTGVLLAGVCHLAKKDSLPAFLSKCEEAKIGLQHIKNEYRIIPENLF